MNAPQTRRQYRHLHGRSATSEYGIWREMIRRCEDPRSRGYGAYGGRGIKVCARWRGSFDAFFADMGSRPTADHQIDRINNDGDYSPENCRWLTRKEQGRNLRRNRRISHNGETLSVTEWSERLNLSRDTISTRLRRGWSPSEALSCERLRPHEREMRMRRRGT